MGAARLLAEEARALGIRRPLVVTDGGIVRAGLLDEVIRKLPGFNRRRLFDRTPSNPTEEAAGEAAALFRRERCDGIIALGGGSPLDLAKAAGLMATHRHRLAALTAAAGGMKFIRAVVPPIIAVPTTAGTGSEVGRAAVMVLKNGSKAAVVSEHLLPKTALCDPGLTLGLPPGLTAGTGMDAISHCVETFLSPTINPPADAIALHGLALACAHLERACAVPADEAARWNMLMASLHGGLAFQKGLGAVHAMSHPLGALPGRTIHHGSANAIFLPIVIRFNEAAVPEKMAQLRRTLGLGARAEVAAYFERLNRRLGLPLTLAEVGVRRSELPHLARAAAADFSARTNPRPARASDYRRMLEAAYE
jgi:4-hydroxybutyrate dehydrogenase